MLVVTAASARWLLEFARATVTEDGTRLIIDNPHSAYARAAVAMGAERNPLLKRTRNTRAHPRRNPLARRTRRPTAARTAASVPTIRTCVRARVIAV